MRSLIIVVLILTVCLTAVTAKNHEEHDFEGVPTLSELLAETVEICMKTFVLILPFLACL